MKKFQDDELLLSTFCEMEESRYVNKRKICLSKPQIFLMAFVVILMNAFAVYSR